jgi:peptidoglycan/LPS O-acetylase OafA/YrhL
LAAFWVVAFHWSGKGALHRELLNMYDLNWWPTWFMSVSSIGYLGVDVFFILSGAVIAKSALHTSPKKFASSRFFRLYPVYILSTTLAFIIGPHAIAGFNGNFSAYFGNLIGFNFIFGGPLVGAAWTLTYEIVFYMLIYLSLRYYSYRDIEFEETHLLNVLFLLNLSSLLGSIALNTMHVQSPTALLGPKFLPYFVLGSCLTMKTKIVDKKFLVVFVFSLYLTGTSLINRSPFSTHEIVFAAIFLLFVIGTIYSSQFYSMNFITPKVKKYVATLSLMTYPIYLFHETIGMSLVSLLDQKAGLIQMVHIFVLGVIFFVSWISVKFYEPSFKRIFEKCTSPREK